MKLIDKDALVAEIEKMKKSRAKQREDMLNLQCYTLADDALTRIGELNYIQYFLDTLEVIDPYAQCIQYPTVRDGIKAHAETYSFNIESELFNQLTKEQQKLWRKEIEQACISGGEAGVELARDPRYKENLEVKEVDFDALGILAEHLIACEAHGVTPKYRDRELDILEGLVNNKAQKGE